MNEFNFLRKRRSAPALSSGANWSGKTMWPRDRASGSAEDVLFLIGTELGLEAFFTPETSTSPQPS